MSACEMGSFSPPTVRTRSLVDVFSGVSTPTGVRVPLDESEAGSPHPASQDNPKQAPAFSALRRSMVSIRAVQVVNATGIGASTTRATVGRHGGQYSTTPGPSGGVQNRIAVVVFTFPPLVAELPAVLPDCSPSHAHEVVARAGDADREMIFLRFRGRIFRKTFAHLDQLPRHGET